MYLWTQLVYLIVIIINNLKFATAPGTGTGTGTGAGTVNVLGHQLNSASASDDRPPIQLEEFPVPFLPVPLTVKEVKSENLNLPPNSNSNLDPILSSWEWDLSHSNPSKGHDARRSVDSYYDELEPDPTGIEVDLPEFYQPQQVLLFRIAASGIASLDPFGGKAHPFFLISYANRSSNNFVYFARTKALSDVRDPRWMEIIKFEKYSRGRGQTLLFEMRDHDAPDGEEKTSWAYIDVDHCVLDSRRLKPNEHYMNVHDDSENEIVPVSSACAALITDENGHLSITLL